MKPENVLVHALAHPQNRTREISEPCSHVKSRVRALLNELGAQIYRYERQGMFKEVIIYATSS